MLLVERLSQDWIKDPKLRSLPEVQGDFQQRVERLHHIIGIGRHFRYLEKCRRQFLTHPTAKLIDIQVSLKRKWDIQRANFKIVLKINIGFALLLQEFQGAKTIKGF